MRLIYLCLLVFVVSYAGACGRDGIAYQGGNSLCSPGDSCDYGEECRAFLIEEREVWICTEPCDPDALDFEECPGSTDYMGPLHDAVCESFDDEGQYSPDGENFWCIKRHVCYGEVVSLDGSADGPEICLEELGVEP